MNRHRNEPVRLRDLVSAFDPVTLFYKQACRFPGVLAQWQHDFRWEWHAPNRNSSRQMLGARGMHTVAERRSAKHGGQLNGLARSIHFSRSFSFGLIGVPGWMISAGHFSAAFTS